MRSSLFLFCLMTAMFTNAATASTAVAYVYVAENTSTTNSPISVYAASSDGKLTQIKGSPFTQVEGDMAGTNGAYFVTVDDSSSHPYLRVYDVASGGAIGKEVSSRDLHPWCSGAEGATLDHSGQFVYVLEAPSCGGAYLSFALSKNGELAYKGSVAEENNPFFELPLFSGNDKFAYNFTAAQNSQPPCPTSTFIGLGRESSGALEKISFSETDPTPPAGYETFQEGLATTDATDHLASVIYFSDGACGESGVPVLASYKIESNGHLVSTNTVANMPALAGSYNQGGYVFDRTILSNPAGNLLAISVGTGTQFFHFNGADPVTPFTGIIGTSGQIETLAWDKENHLYALNSKSGRLHVYAATSKSVVEAAGSPYEPPNTCPDCSQNLVVRSVP